MCWRKLFITCIFRLQKMGALEVDKVVHEHEGWRLVSCIWLHGGAIHVLANMLSLLFIGIRLEQEFGFGMVLVICIWFHYLYLYHCFYINVLEEKKLSWVYLAMKSIKKALLSSVISTFLVLLQLELDFSMWYLVLEGVCCLRYSYKRASQLVHLVHCLAYSEGCSQSSSLIGRYMPIRWMN